MKTSYGFFTSSAQGRVALSSYPGLGPDSVTDGSSWSYMSGYDLDKMPENYTLWSAKIMPAGCMVETSTFNGSFVFQNGQYELVLAFEHQAGMRIICNGRQINFKFQ